MEYALVAAEHITRASEEGYELVAGIGPIEVMGRPALLVCKGRPIAGIPKGSYRCTYLVDEVFYGGEKAEKVDPEGDQASGSAPRDREASGAHQGRRKALFE